MREGLPQTARHGIVAIGGCATALLVVDTDDYLGTNIVDLTAVERRLEKYEQMIEECGRRIK